MKQKNDAPFFSWGLLDVQNWEDPKEEREKEKKMPVKINSLELENVKRVKAVKLEPSASGLTVLGGNNRQGKTSVLDAIAWALGGNKYAPSSPQREGSMVNPNIHLELSNGLIVERTGKNSTLKVIDPSGKKSGQNLLDSFISTFALDLPKFMNADSKTKAMTLLQIIGVGDQLAVLERDEKAAYNRRFEIGHIADQKKKFADEMPQWDGVPEEIVSAAELIKQQQTILAKNGENQRKRENAARYAQELVQAEQAYAEAKKRLEEAQENAEIAAKSAENLQDESTAELEQNIADIDMLNAKIRDNLSKQKASDEAAEFKNQYDNLTVEIEKLREERMKLLDDANMPLPELSVEDGELIYKGQKWDNMSGSEQLMVATSIVRKLNPECGFVLIDKLEQMDLQTMNEFGQWLEENNLQAIATRVSTGAECSIIIEDGYSIKEGVKTAAVDYKPAEMMKEPEPKWSYKKEMK